MHRHSFKLLAALVTFAGLALATPESSLGAKTKFPSQDPAFTIELPRGWTSELNNNGNLSSHPPDDPAYIFTVMDLNRTRSAQELRAALPQLAKSAGLKNFKLGPVEDTESETMKFAEVKGSGEADGLTLVVVVTGFEAQKGRFFALLSVGLESTQKKHAKDFEAIAASIEPLQATGGKETAAAAELPIADTTLGWASKTGDVTVYFQPNAKCTIDFRGSEGRYPRGDGNSRMTKSYEVTSLPGGKWRVRILGDEPLDITFRVTNANPAAKNGQAVITAMGINQGDPYQHGEEAELKFVRGKQSPPSQ